MCIRGKPSMAAAYNPKKFFREPSRLCAAPSRLRKAANAVNAFISIGRTKRVEPAVKRDSVVIEKSYYCSLRRIETCIARSGEPAAMAIRKDCEVA
jgi:hypothetical protein